MLIPSEFRRYTERHFLGLLGAPNEVTDCSAQSKPPSGCIRSCNAVCVVIEVDVRACFHVPIMHRSLQTVQCIRCGASVACRCGAHLVSGGRHQAVQRALLSRPTNATKGHRNAKQQQNQPTCACSSSFQIAGLTNNETASSLPVKNPRLRIVNRSSVCIQNVLRMFLLRCSPPVDCRQAQIVSPPQVACRMGK